MGYWERKQPVDLYCPQCLARGRQSVLMKQNYGSGDIRLTCADDSFCEWSKMVTEEELNAELNRINRRRL